jgi:prepilin-type processing-associated H-X9-DG protein
MRQIGLASQQYAADNDEYLPETGVAPVCDNNSPYSYLGIQPWPVALVPYIKATGIYSCPDDAGVVGRGGFATAQAYWTPCIQPMLNNSHYPGSPLTIKPYASGGTGADIVTAYPLSYASNYYLCTWNNWTDVSTGYAQVAYTQQGQPVMPPLAKIACPSNVFLVTDVGTVNTNYYAAGWYIVPGYGGTGPGTRWNLAGRHVGGRNWIFCDGHAKWFSDPNLTTNVAQDTVIRAYQALGIYTYPDAIAGK